MADTRELAKHIHKIENKLAGCLSSILNELSLPEDFDLNGIDINIIKCESLGTRTTYTLDKVTLQVEWKPEQY